MATYHVLTTAYETRDEIDAHYYVVEDGVLLTFKDAQHKQVASYNLRLVVSVVTKHEEAQGPFASPIAQTA